MKYKLLSLLLFVSASFAEDLVLDNQTSYPEKNKSKLAIQWASSGNEVDIANSASLRGQKQSSASIQIVKERGTIRLAIPKTAEYFRVLIWSKGKETPDLLTNWVDIIPSKTYTLKPDHLIPAVLMCGSGC